MAFLTYFVLKLRNDWDLFITNCLLLNICICIIALVYTKAFSSQQLVFAMES